MNIKIVSNNNTFSDNSQLIGSINENTVPQAQQNETLNELQAIQKKLMSAQELSAQLYQLEQAIRANNQPKIQDIVQQLTLDFSSSLLSNLASSGLLALLGMNT